MNKTAKNKLVFLGIATVLSIFAVPGVFAQVCGVTWGDGCVWQYAQQNGDITNRAANINCINRMGNNYGWCIDCNLGYTYIDRWTGCVKPSGSDVPCRDSGGVCEVAYTQACGYGEQELWGNWEATDGCNFLYGGGSDYTCCCPAGTEPDASNTRCVSLTDNMPSADLRVSPTSVTAGASVTITVTGTDDRGVDWVNPFYNNAWVQGYYCPGDPTSCSRTWTWNTAGAAPGVYRVAGHAQDTADQGYTTESQWVTVSVPCTNECSPQGEKQCNKPSGGNSYRTCGNYDSDTCPEWSSYTLCPSSTPTCDGGDCRAPLDTTKPTITSVDYSPKPVYTGSSVSVSASASDAGGIKRTTVGIYTLSGARIVEQTCNAASCSASGTIPTPGSYTYGTTAEDNAGNTQIGGGSFSALSSDTSPPSVTIHQPSQLQSSPVMTTTESSASFQMTVTDASGVSEVRVNEVSATYMVDKVGGRFNTYIATIPLSVGTNYIVIEAYDTIQPRNAQLIQKEIVRQAACKTSGQACGGTNGNCCSGVDLVCNTLDPYTGTTHSGICCPSNQYYNNALKRCIQFEDECTTDCDPFTTSCIDQNNQACCSEIFQGHTNTFLRGVTTY